MSAKDTIFMYRGGYIPLSDLEVLHAKGDISPDDLIFIARHNYKYFFCCDLKTLEDHYGIDQLFRRTILPENSPDEPSSSTSDQQESIDIPVEEQDSKDEKIRLYQLSDEGFIFVDYPLFHVETEPDPDQITGEEVLKEMEKLKNLLPLKNWSPAQTTKFFMLNRQGKRVAICRLCQFTPYSPLLFFKHMFSHQHCHLLSKCVVSRKSFIYWTDRITNTKHEKQEEVGRETNESSVETSNFILTRLPLIAAADKKTASGILSETQINVLAELYKNMDHNDFGLVPFLRHRSEFCSICQVNIPKTIPKVAKHILTGTHMEKLKTVEIAYSELNLWVNSMRVLLARKDTPKQTVTRIFENRNSPPLPLIDYKLEIELLEENCRNERLETLRQLWEKVPKVKYEKIPYKAFDENSNVTCYACDLPKGTLKTRVDLVEHIFTKNHLNYLVQFGFSERAWASVMARLQKCIDEKGEDTTEEKEEPVENSSAEVEKDTVKMPVPTVQKAVPVTRPRVPLLDPPPPSEELATQQEYVATLREIEKKVNAGGTQLTSKLKEKIVNWNCGYCSTKKIVVTLTTELHAIQHILNQMHKEKMKFRSPAADLAHWTTRINELTGCGTVTAPQKDTPVAVKTVHSTERLHGSPAPKTFGNIPRVPMLDFVPPEHTVVTPQHAKETLNRFNELTSGTAFKKAARSMKVDWKCALCAACGYPEVFHTKYDAIRHIVSRDHRSIIQKTSSQDLSHWEKWINNIRSTKLQKTASGNGSSSKTENTAAAAPEVIKNFPRVPMLDEPLPGHSKVNPQKRNEKMSEFSQITNSPSFKEFTEKQAVSWKCTFCTEANRPIVLSNMHQVAKHIVSKGHRKKMSSVAVDDLEYWNTWFDATIKGLRAEHERKVTEVLLRPKNAPRIALLDIPNADQMWLPSKFCFSRCRVLRKKTRTLDSGNFQDKMPSKCFHCPFSKQMSTVWEVMQHVFDGKHNQNIMNISTDDDFVYWEMLIYEGTRRKVQEPTPQPSVNVPIPPTKSVESKPIASVPPSIPMDPLQRPSPPAALPSAPAVFQICQFPLFAPSTMTFGPQTTGPSIRQLKLLKERCESLLAPIEICFKTPTLCKLCRVDMSNRTLSQVASHAFSFEHLRNVSKTGWPAYPSDFEYWRIRMKCSERQFSAEDNVRLSLIPRTPKPEYLGKSVYLFSLEEQREIDKFDIKNLDQESRNTLLRKYGSCFQCSCFVYDSEAIVPHYTNHRHLSPQKYFYDTQTRQDMSEIMEYVKKANENAPKSSCILM